MNAFELSEHLALRLDEAGLPYAIGGALALTAWGIPRDTKDVDISVFGDDSDLAPVIDALERAGVMLDRADAARSVNRIGMFTGRHGHTSVDVFIHRHPHFFEMQRRRKQVRSASGSKLWFISVEDLALMKLLYNRFKDLGDLERLFGANPELDTGYIRTWLAKMVPANDQRLATLDDLARRFLTRR